MKFTYASGSRPLDGYVIKRGIGVGGFGEVYFATSDAGKEVALKRIQRNLDIELRGVRQCLNLKHVNLLSLFDIRYDDDGEAWVVMEYVAGESLKDVIDRNPHGLPLDEAINWFRGIAAGTAYLHEHGIVHRDLKPGNIFNDDGIVKIGDYGLSKFISCSRRSGQTESVGTFHYMAPEIGKGVYGKEVDVYALGIILYELITGEVPFDGESSQEIIMKHLTADPDLSKLPQPQREAVRRALFKDPDKRFSNVQQMLAALGLAEGDEAPRVALAAAPAGAANRVLEADPVASPPRGRGGDVVYIADDASSGGEMVFGPLRESVAPSPKGKGAAAVHAGGSVAAVEEPIAKAVRESWSDASKWWREAGLSTPVKVIILLALIAAVVFNAQWLVPLGIFLGVLYLGYYGVRTVLYSLRGGAVSTAHPPGALGARVSRTSAGRRRRVDLREVCRCKPLGEKFADLTGSLLLSAAICMVLCFVMIVVGGEPFSDAIGAGSFFAWLAITSVGGAWTILLISKFWEGAKGETMPRRFVMLVAGLVLGLAAFFAAEFLSVSLVDNDALTIRAFSGRHIPVSMYAADGSPRMAAYLVYFGGLFLILRWWRLADPLRSTRFSILATLSCLFWAWILHMFWQFPQPWGYMLAAAMSIAVQLSAPWMNPQERSRAVRRLQEA